MSTNSDLLIKLANVYTFVKSREFNKSLVGYTFANYVEQAKNKIKSDEETPRPTRLARLQSMQDSLSNIIDQAKKTDVSKSDEKASDDDQNES